MNGRCREWQWGSQCDTSFASFPVSLAVPSFSYTDALHLPDILMVGWAPRDQSWDLSSIYTYSHCHGLKYLLESDDFQMYISGLDFSEPQAPTQLPTQYLHLKLPSRDISPLTCPKFNLPLFLLPTPAFSNAFPGSLKNNSIFPLAQAKNFSLP